ncbi:MAG: azurin [Pirellulaceae bacterium]
MVVIEQLPTALIRGLKGAYSQTMASFPLSLLSSQLARLRRSAACCLTGLVLLSMVTSPLSAEELELRQGDHVIIVGGTMPERMQQFNHFETRMQIRHPELELYVRDLAWSADEVALRPRSQAFQDHGHSLQEHGATVVLAFWGFNESFGGEAKLGEFETNLNRWIDETNAIKTADDREMKIVLIAPMAHENLGNVHIPDGSATNANLEIYTAAMQKVAEAKGCHFVDLFHPTLAAMESDAEPWTLNGIHQTEAGDAKIAAILDEALFGDFDCQVDYEAVRGEVSEKNLQFWYDYRAVNGFYIYGGRKEPFGVVNFPAEFAKLRNMIGVRDRRVWAAAKGESLPAEIDDSQTGEFVEIPTNVEAEVVISSPEQQLNSFHLPDGYTVDCFASEVDFPDLKNPVQFAIDARGRVWVCTMPSYPMYLPGEPVNDKILILEDTDGDGKADKQTVFAEGLHLPTGIELGYGGCFVAQQPNLMFLKDTDGDDVADVREIVLHGFDSADSHHSISAFTWGPSGELYFQEGTFHHTQVETPYGPQRVKNASVFRFEPRTWRFEIFVSYGFANPWGHTFDDWGQNFVADASGGANYFGTAFSGDVVYPHKHAGLKQFLVKQWRPTCGCEFVSSHNFPAEAQGNYLLNNCIGFHGVLQYKMHDEGSGFGADPVEPLLRSEDTNFRPVDLQFGADGSLFICDWFNPLVGHMQHNLRDPKRDKNHGRIWRVWYQDNPLREVTDLSQASNEELLEKRSRITSTAYATEPVVS